MGHDPGEDEVCKKILKAGCEKPARNLDQIGSDIMEYLGDRAVSRSEDWRTGLIITLDKEYIWGSHIFV